MEIAPMFKIYKKQKVFLFITFLLTTLFTYLLNDNANNIFEGGHEQVVMDVETKSGHLAPTGLPTGMIIMGRGQEVTLDFPINNEDPDNDVDTITVTIPGAEVTGSSYEWYNSVVHEWTLDNTTDPDTVRYSAQDDFSGSEVGESDYYDVVGNADDALDFVDPVSEKITISVTFKAPDTTGFKTDKDAIQVTAEDLKTEASGSVMEFPKYPFLVTDDGESFFIFILKTAGFNMDILYGNSKLFTPTRASDFLTSENGFLYTEGDQKMAIVDKPTDDTRVVPLITAEDGTTGPFELSWFEFTVTDVSADQVDSETLESAYTESIPEGIGELNLDLDGNGILNSNDPDIDGDGYDNEVDPDPYDDGVGNNRPTGLTPSSNAVDGRIKEGDTLILSATAIDADELTYTWTNQQTEATHTGAEWTITGLEPGIYTFTVEVTDDINDPVNTTITIDVEEEEGKDGISPIIIVLIIIVVLVIIAAVVFFVLRGREGEEEEPMEIPPDVGPPTVEDEYEEPLDETEYPGGPPVFEEEEVYEEEEAPAYEEETVETEILEPPRESQEVQDLESLIEDLESTEEEMEDVCPECGSPLDPTDIECPSCGAQFEVALECPNCGAAVSEDDTACPSCGVSFV